jgi:hypothetical protein
LNNIKSQINQRRIHQLSRLEEVIKDAKDFNEILENQ